MTAPDLDAIQSRSDDAMMHESLEPGSYAEIAWHSARDVPALLALVREQQARIERAETLVDEAIEEYSYGVNVRHADLEAIRAALTATDES